MKRFILIITAAAAVAAFGGWLLMAAFGQERKEKAATPAPTTQQERRLMEAAETLFVAGKYDEAITVYKQLINEYRKSVYQDKAQARVGDCFLEKKDYRMARTAYMLFISNNPTSPYVADAYYHIGDSFLREKNEAAALDAFRYAFNTYPEHARGEQTLFWIATWHADRGQYELAVRNFTRLTEWFPDDKFTEKAWYGLACVHSRMGQYADARHDLATLFSRYPVSALVPQGYLLLGDSYHDLPDYPAKEKAYLDMLERDVLSRVARDRLGDLYRDLHLYAKAISWYAESLRPEYRSHYDDFGRRYLPADSTVATVPTDSVFFSDSLTQVTFLKQTACYLLANDRVRALDQCKRIIVSCPNPQIVKAACCLAASIFYEQDNYPEALKFYAQVPDDECPGLRDEYRKGLCYVKTRQHPRAIETLERTVRRWAAAAPDEQATVNRQLVYLALADELGAEGRWLEAVRCYRLVTDYCRDYVWYRLARCYQTLSMRPETGENVKKLAEQYPNRALAASADYSDTTWQNAYLNSIDSFIKYSPFE
jgi:outer membrane assembly lipoprotein YfiO